MEGQQFFLAKWQFPSLYLRRETGTVNEEFGDDEHDYFLQEKEKNELHLDHVLTHYHLQKVV